MMLKRFLQFTCYRFRVSNASLAGAGCTKYAEPCCGSQ